MAEQDDMSLEQLEAAMAELSQEPKAEVPAADADPEPEKEPEKDDQAPAAEKEPEPEEVKPVDAPAPAEEIPSELDVLKAQLAANQSALEHFKSVSGRNAGEADFLRSKMKDLERQFTVRAEAGDDPDTTRPEPATNDRVSEWTTRQALTVGSAQFFDSNPGAKEFMPQITAYLQSNDRSNVIVPGDPMATQERVKGILQEAYWGARQEHEAAHAAALSTKRATQIANLDRAKKVSAPSASGGAPPKKDTAKKIDDMSIKELESALAHETGGRW